MRAKPKSIRTKVEDLNWVFDLARDMCGSYPPDEMDDARAEVDRIRKDTIRDVRTAHDLLKPPIEGTCHD